MSDSNTGYWFQAGQFALEVPAFAEALEVDISAPARSLVMVVQPRDDAACAGGNIAAIRRFRGVPGGDRFPQAEEARRCGRWLQLRFDRHPREVGGFLDAAWVISG